MKKLLQDEKWLREQYTVKYRSGIDIAQEIGCSKYTVYRVLKKFNIERRDHTSRFPLLNDKEWLTKVYLKDKMSLNEIADLVGSTSGNIHCALIAIGLETRGHKEGLATKFPDGRRGEQNPRWKGGRRECAKPNPIYKGRLGALAPNWKGGRRIAAGGYIYIYIPDHPNATKAGCVMEHRLVAEKHLGRYLQPGEIVHHKNGDRQDNRWENLEVATRSQHVSNHFANGYMLKYWKDRAEELRQRVAELEAENKQLRAAA